MKRVGLETVLIALFLALMLVYVCREWVGEYVSARREGYPRLVSASRAFKYLDMRVLATLTWEAHEWLGQP
jgi:hypothetical protein